MTVYCHNAHPIGTFLAGMLALTTVSAGLGAQPPCPPQEKIAFTSVDPLSANLVATAELNIMNPDGSDVLRLTNDGFGDSAASLSKDNRGKMIFDSNRTAIALGAPLTSTNSDLFLINYDGTRTRSESNAGDAGKLCHLEARWQVDRIPSLAGRRVWASNHRPGRARRPHQGQRHLPSQSRRPARSWRRTHQPHGELRRHERG